MISADTIGESARIDKDERMLPGYWVTRIIKT